MQVATAEGWDATNQRFEDMSGNGRHGVLTGGTVDQGSSCPSDFPYQSSVEPAACFNTDADAAAGTGPCGSWCTRDVTICGGDCGCGANSGRMCSAGIPFVGGTTTTTIEWPAGSIPATFTICSITRVLPGSPAGRVLTAGDANWLHGHWSSAPGATYYVTAGGMLCLPLWLTVGIDPSCAPSCPIS